LSPARLFSLSSDMGVLSSIAEAAAPMLWVCECCRREWVSEWVGAKRRYRVQLSTSKTASSKKKGEGRSQSLHHLLFSVISRPQCAWTSILSPF
jgi:hypothetical protein